MNKKILILSLIVFLIAVNLGIYFYINKKDKVEEQPISDEIISKEEPESDRYPPRFIPAAFPAPVLIMAFASFVFAPRSRLLPAPVGFSGSPLLCANVCRPRL